MVFRGHRIIAKEIMMVRALVAFLTMIAGCSDRAATAPSESPDISSAKAAVVRLLKDPDSAQFRDVAIVKSKAYTAVCGEINAKNGFGGYVGFQPFYALSDGQVAIATSDDVSAASDFNVLLKTYCTPAN
jgi:outer membrane murein-binding lipoprotein Lpp